MSVPRRIRARRLLAIVAAVAGCGVLAAPVAAQAAEDVRLYEHADLQGSYFVPAVNSDGWISQPSFHSVNCFLWFCSDFNDRVSSVRLNANACVTLHEHDNFEGAERDFCNFTDHAGYYNLWRVGWNDIASSASETLGVIEQSSQRQLHALPSR